MIINDSIQYIQDEILTSQEVQLQLKRSCSWSCYAITTIISIYIYMYIYIHTYTYIYIYIYIHIHTYNIQLVHKLFVVISGVHFAAVGRGRRPPRREDPILIIIYENIYIYIYIYITEYYYTYDYYFTTYYDLLGARIHPDYGLL